MSWITQLLWNNREQIKTKIHGEDRLANAFAMSYDEELNEEDMGYKESLLDNDELNDLLMIEKAISELKDLQLFSEEDLEILYSSGISNKTRNQKYWYDKKLYSLCERIAYYLGGYFTDEGYIDYLTRKYKLTHEQQEVARNYMDSKFKNKILSKGYEIENNHEETRIISTEMSS